MIEALTLPVTLAARDGEFSVRAAESADLDVLVALIANDPVSAARGDTASPDDLDAYARGLEAVQADPRNVQLVAERDGVVIGTLQLTLIPGISRRGAARLQVEAVRVRDDQRSAGIGRALMRWVGDVAPTLGARLVQLTSDAQRVDAHRFYERLGYEASHVGYKLHV
ncbi:GNAT family N-acetyltransferase [Microbacterium sp. JZ31]|uniref:GNAT family N-acetyltransferase n=1 Tax=Microbacterium sp. JZ31 TaxID=1906274 RepID=UPI0019337309|nr:GNAT family N-acetyltransferase [Microbacterium sp. JZ31]